MRPFGKPIIPSEKLARDDVPVAKAQWREIIEFSATFDIQSELPQGTSVSGVDSVGPESSVSELRCALYVEWRRYNHFGHYPEDQVLQQARRVLAWIREKLDLAS